ncbi:MAG: tRNA (N(6)-L-threonylcarbamoyladenosine(37)-C(2))-methylthiotransferase [Candidatus Marsarchaeota archaeon]|nr:tRNA (N(6)-L-threonylcarbamoyladenosine(37)-C(2))-methylthiotransferase [Candidatus Marsarchaeota archaeon]
MQTYIKTYGCTLNQADSDIIAGIIGDAGIGRSDSEDDADVVIINTCTVKSVTERKILEKLSRMDRGGKKVVVTGCMAAANPDLIAKYAPNASIVTMPNVSHIPGILDGINSGKRYTINKYEAADRITGFKPAGSTIAKIPISDGCLSSCSFCETKFARGMLNSFSEDLIVNAIKYSIKSGSKEIQLASQDTGAYGLDKGTNIARLMHRISSINGDFRVRIGMLNPEHLGKYMDDIVDAFSDKRFYRFIHLPVQSGSDRILKAMRRNYTAEDFIDRVAKLRKEINGLSLETDIIVGFPGEAKTDLEATIDLMNCVKPDVTNISRFAARPHASAARLKQIKPEEVKERSSQVLRVARRIQHEINNSFINKKIDVLMTEETEASVNGRTDSYKQVVIKKTDTCIPEVGMHYVASVYAESANVLYGKII